MSIPSRSPTPLPPSASLENASGPKSPIRITVLSILALHVVFIGGLLLQGCQKSTQDPQVAAATNAEPADIPSLVDTQYFSSFPGDMNTGSSSSGSRTPEPTDYSLSSYSSGSSYSTSVIEDPVIPDVATSPSTFPTDRQSSSTYSSGRSTSSFPDMPVAPTMDHVIARGDTIDALARQYGVTSQAILDANPGVRARSLKVGSRLVIPPPSASTTSRPSGGEPEVTAPPGGNVYTVQKGDTLSKIARRHGVTVSQLRSANNLRGDRILPKQKLVIPPKNP